MDKSIAMYIFINSDLQMTKGKAVAQACHVVEQITEKIIHGMYAGIKNPAYTQWKRSGRAKIVLRATQAQLDELIRTNPEIEYIRDEGLTQVMPGSLTAAGFPPMPKSACFKEFTLL